MNSKIRLHLSFPPAESQIDYLRSLVDPSVDITFGSEIEGPEHVDYLAIARPTEDLLASCGNLKGVVIPFAGIPEETRAVMLKHPELALYNLHHNVIPVAEHALGLLLAVAKRHVYHDSAIRQHDWRTRYEKDVSINLAGRTALILGYGNIGQRLGYLLNALGIKIMAIRNSIQSSADDFSEVHLSDELDSLLPLSDILVVILPLTPKTEGLIGEDEINLLPEGSILVNVGRGKVVDQRALYNALKSKHLYGAGIDVWYNYPADVDTRQNKPPADYPFHELDNIVMSPHRAGGVNSSDTERLRIEHLAQLINHAARGEDMPNGVDVYKGY